MTDQLPYTPPKLFPTTSYTSIYTDEDTNVHTCDLTIESVGTMTMCWNDDLKAWYFMHHDWPVQRFLPHTMLVNACVMELDNYQYQQAYKEQCLMIAQAQSLDDLQRFSRAGLQLLELVRNPEKWLRLACLICHEPEDYPLHYSQGSFERMLKRAQGLSEAKKAELILWAQSYLLTYLSYCKMYAPLLFEGNNESTPKETNSFMMLEADAKDTEHFYNDLIRKLNNVTPKEIEAMELGLDLKFKQHLSNMIKDSRESKK